MSNENQRSEDLFDTLSKNKKKKKRKLIRTVLIVIAVIAVILIAAVVHLRNQVKERFASTTAEVLTYEVAAGTINTLVSGSGTLTQVDLESLTVPPGVEINEVTVSRNDTVAAGDLLATVDMASVMTALSDLQTQLDELDEQIADAKGDEVSSYLSAGISGRVKRIFGESGMDVSACMAQHGGLALISLDGYMAVDIETDALTRGADVQVVLAGGSQIDGTVESAVNGTATVLVSDNGPAYEEEVTVVAEDGKELGKGTLYIHSPLAVTGYAGTISTVNAKENQKVYSGTSLFTLKNTSFSANYDTLLRQRSELEETLLEILTIYRDGAVLAPMDGTVSSIDYTEDEETTVLYTTQTEETATSLLTLYPGLSMSITIGIDETDILSLEVGQEAQVTVSSVSEDAFTGTVTEISKEATTSTGVTQYSAVITVDKADGMLPGMTAEVDVTIEGVENALIIPVDALHQTSAISYVYTSYDEETQQYGGMVEVTTGMQNDNYVEILSGLALGDTIYYTEKQSNNWFSAISGMGGMGGMGGMSGMSEMPDMSNMGGRGEMGSSRPNMGGMGQGG